MPDRGNLTERQEAWFRSLREGLARDTGRTLDEWVEIARGAPEGKWRAKLAWMKSEHGLGQNRAALVLSTAFPDDAGWSTPDALGDALWTDPAARAIYTAARARIEVLPDVIVGQRKGFTAFSRNVQFAAMRPAGKAVVLGLAVDPAAHPSLTSRGRAAWSDRLTAEARLAYAQDARPLEEAIRAAWDRS